MTFQNLLRDGVIALSHAGVPSASLDARLLLEHATGFDRAALVLKAQEPAPFDIEDIFKTLIQMRAKRIPLAKIVGVKEFWSLSFKTTKDTLDPRPDSETLIEAVIAHVQDYKTALRVLDVGTGTGCLILTLLHHYKKAVGVGSDYSKAALTVAQENGKALDLDDRVEWAHSNWLDSISGQFDIIISNPPYIPFSMKPTLDPEVTFDPESALFADDDGLAAYAILARQIPAVMAPKATVFLEIGVNQEQSVKTIFHNAGFKWLHTRCDLGMRPRCLVFTQ